MSFAESAFELPESLESPLTRSLLAENIKKYPPRENLVRGIAGGKAGSPPKYARAKSVGFDPNVPLGSHASVITPLSMFDSLQNGSPIGKKGLDRGSPLRQVDGRTVSPSRGSLLSPYNFMTASTEALNTDELTSSEMVTIHRQLVLLRLQMAHKNNQDRLLSKDQVLQAWYHVTEVEERAFLMERKLSEFQSVYTAQRKLEDMVSISATFLCLRFSRVSKNVVNLCKRNDKSRKRMKAWLPRSKNWPSSMRSKQLIKLERNS